MLAKLLSQLQEQQADVTNSTVGLTTALELSWNSLDEFTQQIGMMLSLFALAPIPQGMLEQVADASLATATNREAIATACTTLNQRHLLQCIDDTSYHLLPAIRVYLQAKLDQSAQSDRYKQAFAQVMVAFAKRLSDPPPITECTAFAPAIPHIAKAATTLQPWLINESIVFPFFCLGRFYVAQGALKQATQWYEQGLSEARNQLGNEHLAIAASLTHLANLYYTQDYYEAAAPLYQEAFKLLHQLVGEEHPATIISLANFENLQKFQKKFKFRTADKVDFTVVIPTYNGEKRLPDVLDRLQSQIDLDNLSWEVIVVDNNSKDGTAKVVQDYQAEWTAHCPLKYCLEPRQGAAFARQRAVTEAKGSYVGFLDDDNVPALNWVAAAYVFGETHPKAGAFGSRIQGDYEVAPPEEFEKIARYLAIIDQGSKPRLYKPEKRMFPPGAGLVVLRQAWLEAVPERLLLNNIGQEIGLASEDLEAVLYIQKAGWELWYNPEMQVHHKIPYWRLERDYLVSVFRCIGLSSHHIRMLSFAAWQRPFAFLMYLASDLRKLILHFIKYRKTIKDDLIAACEMELLINSLISPFFLLKKRF